jgi:hypothetical protein
MSREYFRNLLEEFCLHYSWRFVEKLPERAFLVKRISHATMQIHSFRSALHASRTTSDEERSSGSEIAAEAFMNNAG